MADFTPIHPGEVLLKDFIEPLEVSHDKLAADLCTSEQHMGEIITGNRSITVETAMRLASFFGTSPQFWLNMQHQYDLVVFQKNNGGNGC
ncbi:HigA family addiction module antitoxin [Pseudodesulfovibrio senegalensis]|uniref:HigA family addiction module antidote protein n=1 Tax=Pseudodesulfovibrio senegalensis TaxID=1721087 RepID=A0A6N6N9T5_9BACT|nr:HigA family addiction module antitoxin [Pseudodesulfovibrio senegalensis]KAB1443557.1 HigA family addiction module antidote protein [Pseudodesulfovibrio senegalensis]